MSIPEEQLYAHIERHEQVIARLDRIGRALIEPVDLGGIHIYHPIANKNWLELHATTYELAGADDQLIVGYDVDVTPDWDDPNDTGVQQVEFTMPISWVTDDDFEEQICKHICNAYVKHEDAARERRKQEAERNAKILAEMEAEQEAQERSELLRLLEKYPDVR